MSPDPAVKDFDHDDPMAIVGVHLAASPDAEADREMVRTFATEFRLLGWTRAEIEGLFHSPRYAGTHGVVRRRGGDFVRSCLDDLFGPEDS